MNYWKSPTSFNDPDDAWVHGADAYDGNTATLAWATSPHWGSGWSPYIEFSLPCEMDCSKMRFWAWVVGEYPSSTPEASVDIWYGDAWHNVYNGALNQLAWTIASFAQQKIMQCRIRLRSATGSDWFSQLLYELEFYVDSITRSFDETPVLNADISQGLHRPFNETLSLSEFFKRGWTFNEILALADDCQFRTHVIRVFSEASGLSDELSRGASRIFAEHPALPTRLATGIARALAEQLALKDKTRVHDPWESVTSALIMTMLKMAIAAGTLNTNMILQALKAKRNVESLKAHGIE